MSATHSRHMRVPAYTLMLLLCLAFFPCNGLASHGEVAPLRLTLSVGGHDLKLPYYANRALGSANSDVIRAVVVVHGSSRNAGGSYDIILRSAIESCGVDRTTIVVAPQFHAAIDIVEHELPEDVLYWSETGWKQGDHSLSLPGQPRPALISSFAVVDAILTRLAKNNPNLQTIVLAGHSAGGQFVNRYVAGSSIEQSLTALYGIKFKHIVANPASYVYLNEDRRIAGTFDQFAVPAVAACPIYNDYKYGLGNLNPYMSATALAQIRTQYSEREVAYLLGENDNDPDSDGLATNCSAMLQGDTRIERGIIYYRYLEHFFGASIRSLHRLAIIPDVAHSQSGIFFSPCAKYHLFDYGRCNSDELFPEGTAAILTVVAADIQTILQDANTPPKARRFLNAAMVPVVEGRDLLNKFDFPGGLSKIEKAVVALEKAAAKGAAAQAVIVQLISAFQAGTEWIIGEAAARLGAGHASVQQAQSILNSALAAQKAGTTIHLFGRAFTTARGAILRQVNVAGNWSGRLPLKRSGTSEKVGLSLVIDQSATNVTGTFSFDSTTGTNQGNLTGAISARAIAPLDLAFLDGSSASGSGKADEQVCRLSLTLPGTDTGGPFTLTGQVKKR